jgi:sirohydrochlorin ferrochelatase
MPSLPPLVLAAHGSPHHAHRPVIEALRDGVGRKGDTTIGWIDHHEPGLRAAVIGAGAPRRTLLRHGSSSVAVVPLLLTNGYHARVDVPTMLDGLRGIAVARALGPDRYLAGALLRRLDDCGTDPGSAVVLAAAGSSDPAALTTVTEVAAFLQDLRPGRVTVGVLSGEGPTLRNAVARAVAEDPLVTVSTFLIAPGTLATRISSEARAAGALRVAEPIGSGPELVELVRARWAQAAARL